MAPRSSVVQVASKESWQTSPARPRERVCRCAPVASDFGALGTIGPLPHRRPTRLVHPFGRAFQYRPTGPGRRVATRLSSAHRPGRWSVHRGPRLPAADQDRWEGLSEISALLGSLALRFDAGPPSGARPNPAGTLPPRPKAPPGGGAFGSTASGAGWTRTSDRRIMSPLL